MIYIIIGLIATMGVIVGFTFCFILFLVAYAMVKELIDRWGVEIKQKALNNLSKLEEKTISANIVYPDFGAEKFAQSESIDELLKNDERSSI